MNAPLKLLVLVVVAGLLVGAGIGGASRPDGARHDFAEPADALYKSPINMVMSADGARLFVVCENSDSIVVVDTADRRVVDEVEVGRHPFDAALSPDGARLFVSNRWDDSVSVLDIDSLQVVETFAAGGDPHGLVVDARGETLYVANLYDHDVALYDTRDFEEIKRLAAGQQPFEVALGASGDHVYVSNQLTNPVPFRQAPISEITIIDASRQIVADRRLLPSTNISQGVAVDPAGDWVLVALEIPKNLLPETQIYQGWMVTYGVAVAEARPGGRVALLLLDEMNRYFADPFGISVSPDGRFAYVSSSGVDIVSVVDLEAVEGVLEVEEARIGASDSDLERLSRNLGISSEYVVARIPTGQNPKDVVFSSDGRWAWVANRLSDSLTVIDVGRHEAVATVDLGGPEETTLLRRGEALFNGAVISFQQQMACNTCHPEHNVDGLIYDIAVDGGLGGNLVDNRTLRGVAYTGPFKWSGKNPTLARQEGPRAAQLFFRSHGFTGADRDAVVAFIESIPLPSNRETGPGGELTPAQRRGKLLFERDRTNDGRYIPIANRCITCHGPPYGTDREMHDVGTKAWFDTEGVFDTPQLANVKETAPYLHDGRCWTLEEIWTLYNPYDLHGVANDMTKQQLNDLIEYLKTL